METTTPRTDPMDVLRLSEFGKIELNQPVPSSRFLIIYAVAMAAVIAGWGAYAILN